MGPVASACESVAVVWGHSRAWGARVDGSHNCVEPRVLFFDSSLLVQVPLDGQAWAVAQVCFWRSVQELQVEVRALVGRIEWGP